MSGCQKVAVFFMRILLVLIFLLATSIASPGQAGYFVMEGKVTDAVNGDPIPFASVGITGRPVGTSTNAVGEFSFKVPNELAGRELKVSCVGYENFIGQAAAGNLNVLLKPGKTVLKDVLVTGRDLRPDKIVKKSFGRIKKNYPTKPFLYKTFYRHYCKDDSLYGRLIEAAVDVYKKKGHRWQAPAPGTKEEVRVTQLRRSFDQTRVGNGHAPIALFSAMGPDPVSYQAANTTFDFMGVMAYNVSRLRYHIKNFEFELEGLTEYDGQEVYRIHYRSKEKPSTLISGIQLKQNEQGTLFIDTKNLAIVRSEWTRQGFDTISTVTAYRKVGDKYFWNHTSKEGRTYIPQIKFKHVYHLDMMVNEVVFKDFEKFKGKEPTREILQQVKYDSSFWNNYTILKSTPLEDKIVADLGGNLSLAEQFVKYDSVERVTYSAERLDQQRFEQFRNVSKGRRILYIDFWASWCAPCIQEMVAEKRLLEKYGDQITFVLISIDRDEKAWKTARDKYKLNLPGFHHYRFGPEADLLTFFEVTSIPRYVLINKNGDFFALDAKRPSDPLLVQDFETLLKESEQD